MKRPPGMPKWKWAMRNAPPTREEQLHESKMRLQEFKVAGVEWVEWLTAGYNECPHCLAMAGKIMKIDEVPFIEHPDCEHENGCRCVIIAVKNPSE